MTLHLNEMTGEEISLFADVFRDLALAETVVDPRQIVAERVLRIMRSDILASFIWNEATRSCTRPVVLNQDEGRVRRYLERQQFKEPITSHMCVHDGANMSEDDCLPMSAFACTAFNREFPRTDDMFHGINIFVHDGDRRIFDLRLWRNRTRPEFEQRDIDLLNTIARHMLPAVRRVLSCGDESLALTARETEIARLVARGCIDREIAGVLGISFSTVRTHINRCFEKLGCSNRAELSSRFAVTVSARIPA